MHRRAAAVDGTHEFACPTWPLNQTSVRLNPKLKSAVCRKLKGLLVSLPVFFLPEFTSSLRFISPGPPQAGASSFDR